MKHVGLNVAADPLFTVSYTGVKGGLVIMVADDPGMHSSQNEQDSRHYARAAKIPMLEPASSQEAYDFTLKAFELSEKFDTPILLRTTTRISHGKSVVITKDNVENNCVTERPDNKAKYVMVPAFARGRHVVVEDRYNAMQQMIEADDYFTKVEMNSTEVGIITNSVSYNYVKEVMPSASILKLGMTYPLPIEK
jgi:indolepyruvate ferredoxin oxidoreductase alpha subunit